MRGRDAKNDPPSMAAIAPQSRPTICVAEGEKDVEALRAMGFIATCNPMGAGKWPDHFAEHFHGFNVVILPDHDEPGRKHGRMVARNLAPVAERVRIVELPGLPHKGDVSDWIAAGGNSPSCCSSSPLTSQLTPH